MCRIFLSYSKEDAEQVNRLYDAILAAGFEPWMDQRNLFPGQNWELEIRRAIQGADLFIACLSEKSLARRGIFHKELALALEVAQEFPENKVYFIPIRLDDCDIPLRMRHIHWLDFFSHGSTETLLRALMLYCGENLPPSGVPSVVFGPDPPKTSREQSVYYKERGREEVREWGKKAARGEWGWHNLGNALEDYLDAIRYDPQHQHPWTNIAYVYHLIGERDLAELCMERSYSLAGPGPNHPGRNYKNVRAAIDNNVSLTGYTFHRPEAPDWFRKKYADFLSIGPGIETNFRAVRAFLMETMN